MLVLFMCKLDDLECIQYKYLFHTLFTEIIEIVTDLSEMSHHELLHQITIKAQILCFSGPRSYHFLCILVGI